VAEDLSGGEFARRRLVLERWAPWPGLFIRHRGEGGGSAVAGGALARFTSAGVLAASWASESRKHRQRWCILPCSRWMMNSPGWPGVRACGVWLKLVIGMGGRSFGSCGVQARLCFLLPS